MVMRGRASSCRCPARRRGTARRRCSRRGRACRTCPARPRCRRTPSAGAASAALRPGSSGPRPRRCSRRAAPAPRRCSEHCSIAALGPLAALVGERVDEVAELGAGAVDHQLPLPQRLKDRLQQPERQADVVGDLPPAGRADQQHVLEDQVLDEGRGQARLLDALGLGRAKAVVRQDRSEQAAGSGWNVGSGHRGKETGIRGQESGIGHRESARPIGRICAMRHLLRNRAGKHRSGFCQDETAREGLLGERRSQTDSDKSNHTALVLGIHNLHNLVCEEKVARLIGVWRADVRRDVRDRIPQVITPAMLYTRTTWPDDNVTSDGSPLRRFRMSSAMACDGLAIRRL